MKVRTNLTPDQLEKIAKNLKKAANKQRFKPYKPENNAEKEMLRQTNEAFDMMLTSLQEDIAEILL